MWFKNLQLYRFARSAIRFDEIESALARYTFNGCGGLDRRVMGWTPASPNGALLHTIATGPGARHHLVTLCVEEKILPASVIAMHTQERAAKIEQQQGYRPGRKQLREIREAVETDLLPRAFCKRRITRAWINPADGMLAVDAASPTQSEELLTVLRKAVPDLSLHLHRTVSYPASAMTQWLYSGEAPSGFSIDQGCELVLSGGEKRRVKFTNHDLSRDVIAGHIETGKSVAYLAMTWNDRVSFVLTADMKIKRLAFLDIVKEAAEEQAETADEQFAADFTIMAGELTRLIADLTEALGGPTEQFN